MEDSKTLALYILSVAGLILVSFLFTSRTEQPEVEPPQPAPVTSTLTTAKPTANLSTLDQTVCTAPNQVALYRPEMSHLEGDRLVISGTVYASNSATPLPNVPIEVWLTTEENRYDPHFPPYNAFHDWFHTDETGHYEATTP